MPLRLASFRDPMSAPRLFRLPVEGNPLRALKPRQSTRGWDTRGFGNPLLHLVGIVFHPAVRQGHAVAVGVEDMHMVLFRFLNLLEVMVQVSSGPV